MSATDATTQRRSDVELSRPYDQGSQEHSGSYATQITSEPDSITEHSISCSRRRSGTYPCFSYLARIRCWPTAANPGEGAPSNPDDSNDSNGSNYPNGSSYSMSISGYRTDPYRTDPYGNPIWSDAATGQPTGKITPHNGGRTVTFPQCFPLLQVSASTASQSSSLQDATTNLPKGRTIG